MRRPLPSLGPTGIVPVLAFALAAAACGPTEPAEVRDVTPVITIAGVTDGEQATAPLTITISVSAGTYRALLNGLTFTSGRTVAEPGDYVLEVDAINGSASTTVSIAFSIVLEGESFLVVRVFDLGSNDAGGGGDAILLTDSSGNGQRHLLVDAGPAGTGGADPAFVWRELQALGVDTLEMVMLSHAHSDHFAGLPDVVQGADLVKEFVYNGQVRSFAAYTSFVTLARASAQTVTVPSAVVTGSLGLGASPTDYTIVPPLTSYLSDPNATSAEINDGSIGLLVTKGPFRMFLTGDGEVQANQRWRTQFGSVTTNVTALKVGHHQANDAVFDDGFNGATAWLAHANPVLTIASANGTSHPRINATSVLLARTTTTVRCTNVHGRIEIRVNDTGLYAVSVEKNEADPCEAGANAST